VEQTPARQSLRYEVVQLREFPLCLIPFKSLVSTIMIAHVVDISAKGAGIESGQHLEPGFVWFRDRVGGFKGGLIVWSRQVGEKYRAGIRFVPLTREKELLVQDRITAIRPLEPLNNPEVVISTILEAMTQDQPDGQQAPDKASRDELKTLRSADGTPTEEDLISQLRSMLSAL
jgi:hypothetical protein